MQLLELLNNYFSEGQTVDDAYEELTNVLYDVGNIICFPVEEMIERLDDEYHEVRDFFGYDDLIDLPDKEYIKTVCEELNFDAEGAPYSYVVRVHADEEEDYFSSYDSAVDYCKSVKAKGGTVLSITVEFYAYGLLLEARNLTETLREF